MSQRMPLSDLVGLVGVAAYVSAYALLQLGRLHSGDGRYLLLNGLGSVCLLMSLMGNFNLPSFVTQALWLFFTLVGFVGLWRRARAARPVV